MTSPIRIRASSFGELLDCAHRWEAKHILGMRKPASGAARLGTAIHAGTAAFDRGRVLGSPIRAADAVDVFMETLVSKDEPVRWEEDMRLHQAQDIGSILTALYCTQESPKWQFIAVELALKDMAVECDSVSILLTGTMDRGRVLVGADGLGVNDLKTGARAVDGEGRAVTKGHGPQQGVYELLVEHTLGQKVTEPASITGMRTSKQPAIGTGLIPGARDMLVGTPETPGLLDFAADTLKSGMFRPNPQSRLCSPKYCVRWDSCRYHE